MFNWVLITLLYQYIAIYELETERLIELQLTRGNKCLMEMTGKYESGILIICLMKFYWKKGQLSSIATRLV